MDETTRKAPPIAATRKIDPEPPAAQKPAPRRPIRTSRDTAPKSYLGGTVQSVAAEEQERRRKATSTREASDVLLKCIRTVKSFGGTVKDNVVRIPPQYAGTSAVDWLAQHGYRIVWA